MLKYFFQKNDSLTLINIKLYDENKKGFYIFLDKNDKQIEKHTHKTKLPISTSFIKYLKDLEVFIETEGILKIFKCIDVIPTTKLPYYKLEVSNIKNQEEKIIYHLDELIIRPKSIYLSIYKSQNFKESEINLMNWLSKRHLQVYLYLKKPVNILEIGYIQKIDFKIHNTKFNLSKDKNNSKITILFTNIFEKEINIPFHEIEMIYFEYNTALIQLKSETSVSSRIGFRILKKFKPERIIMP